MINTVIISIAQLWQKVCATRRDFKWVIYFEVKFRLKGYVSGQYLWNARWGNGYANFAAGSFHTKSFV